MATYTPIRDMEEIPAGSGAPEVPANEMFRGLELLGFFVVKDKDLTTPPGSPVDGDAYFIPSGSSTPWNTHIGEIAYSVGGGANSWEYLELQNGDHLLPQDEPYTIYRRVSGALEAASKLANNVYLTGRETGGTGRNLLGIDGSNVVQLGASTNATQINGSALTIAPNVTLSGSAPLLNVGNSAVTTAAPGIQVGQGRTGSGDAYLDLVGDTTYTDYGTRLIRSGTANGETNLAHRGTGSLIVKTEDAAPIEFKTSGTTKVTIAAALPELYIGGTGISTQSCVLEIGQSRTGDGAALVDFHAQAGVDYDARILRNSGANGAFELTQLGSGNLYISCATGSTILVNSTNNGIIITNTGATKLPSISTTASAANAYLDSGDSNNVLRSTCAEIYKSKIEPIDPARIDALLGAAQHTAIWFESLADADVLPDGGRKSFYSFSADRLAAIDPRLAQWGYAPEDRYDVTIWDGWYCDVRTEQLFRPGAQLRPDGLNIPGIVALLYDEIIRLRGRVNTLEHQTRGEL